MASESGSPRRGTEWHVSCPLAQTSPWLNTWRTAARCFPVVGRHLFRCSNIVAFSVQSPCCRPDQHEEFRLDLLRTGIPHCRVDCGRSWLSRGCWNGRTDRLDSIPHRNHPPGGAVGARAHTARRVKDPNLGPFGHCTSPHLGTCVILPAAARWSRANRGAGSSLEPRLHEGEEQAN
jgi:hypothetical protein